MAELSSPRRRRVIGLAAASVLLETAALWWRARRFGGWVTVRCREGHLFTTIWIPAVSIKSLRLGPWRVQRCPIGRHWTVVTPVNIADLRPQERLAAAEQRDLPLP